MNPRSKLAQDSPSTLVVRVLEGRHAGARFECADGEVMLIGSGADCDLVLADPGVAGHHCLVRVQRGRIWVRAVDEGVLVRGREVPPGDPIAVGTFEPIGPPRRRLPGRRPASAHCRRVRARGWCRR